MSPMSELMGLAATAARRRGGRQPAAQPTPRRLTTLDLSHNRITSLGSSPLGGFGLLTTLLAGGNMITSGTSWPLSRSGSVN